MVNIVQQGLGKNYYNVWEDVDLTQTTANNNGLTGHYVVHSLTNRNRSRFEHECHWTYDDLYVIKDIYGGFLEFLKE